MGLDTVEIVMDCEETFGISIPDADAAAFETPRDLAAFITERVGASSDPKCPTREAYLALLSEFKSHLPALTTELSLDTPLSSLVHRDQWDRVWAAVRSPDRARHWPVTVPWNGLLSSGPKTFRDLVWLVTYASARAAAGQPWTQQTVYLRVREIIVEHSGVEPGFSAHKTFPALGID